MGGGVHCHQPGRLDIGIDLRGRQAGMAEEFLDRPQISSMGKEVGGEGVPEGVRGCRRAEAEAGAEGLHQLLHGAGTERAAPRGAEERRILRQFKRAETGISLDGRSDRGTAGR